MTKDQIICLVALLAGVFGMIFCYFLMTVAFGVSPWISIPIGFVGGVVSPFTGGGL
jgi:hypothetical protein